MWTILLLITTSILYLWIRVWIYITLEDFTDLVRLAIDEDYDGIPDSVAREAVIYECARIWAEQTGKSLDQLPL